MFGIYQVLCLLALYCGLIQNKVLADVGVNTGAYDIRAVSQLVGPNWKLVNQYCFLGNSHSLVVDPEVNFDFLGPQPLGVNVTGPKVCMWLQRLFDSHQALKSKWEKCHQMKKSKILYFDIFERLRLRFLTFPQFRVNMHVSTLDLWHDDHFGNPAPWVRGRLQYSPPSALDGYGIFDKLRSWFSTNEDDLPVDVFLLLAPAPTFNSFVPRKGLQSTFSHKTSAVFAGLGGFDIFDSNSLDISSVTVNLLSVFDAKSNVQIPASVNDFWFRGSTCYMRTRLAMGPFTGVSACSFVQNKASSDIVSGIVKDNYNSVGLVLSGMDLFQSDCPILAMSLYEGTFGRMHDSMSLDTTSNYCIVTDPHVREEFKIVSKTQRKVRFAAGLARTLYNAFSFYTLMKQDSS